MCTVVANSKATNATTSGDRPSLLLTDSRRNAKTPSNWWENSEPVDNSLLGQKATRIHHRLQFKFRTQTRQDLHRPSLTLLHWAIPATTHKPLRTRWMCPRGGPLGCTEDGEHELIVVDLDPPILCTTKRGRDGQSEARREIEHFESLTLSVSIFWNASVNCLMTTQALTNRSKVIPLAWDAAGGRPPNPGTGGGAAMGAALNMSSPEEDIISDHRDNRAGQAR